MRWDSSECCTTHEWEPGTLRRFTLDHVLLHEIGHHVQWMERQRQGFTGELSVRVKEQFAEAYALRHSRRR